VPARDIMEPAPIETNEKLANEGVGKIRGRDLTVANPAAKLPAPWSQDPGQVQVTPPAAAGAPEARIAIAGASDGIGNVEVTMQLPQSAPRDTTAAASTFEGSHDDFLINDVPDPTMELFLDPLLHPDKESCMMEFGLHFFKYTKVSNHTISNVDTH
jgi:hypothetical protein